MNRIQYYIGDMEYQEKLLSELLMWAPQQLQMQAQRRMRKRLYKHYGLLNKYDGRGNLRYS